MELSAEEKAMNGAPEGELFEVTVLPREALETSGNAVSPADELRTVVLPALTASLETPWNVVFDALTSLRRILVYHPHVVTSNNIEALVPGIEKAIRNLRSVLAKNAICCAEDLFLKCSAELNLSQTAVDTLCLSLLDSCASNVAKALRAASALALDQAVLTGPTAKLIPALASRSSAKNADVAEAAMVYCEKAVRALSSGPGSISTFAIDLDLARILPGLHFGVNAKSVKCKKAAKSCCVLLASSLTQAKFEAKIDEHCAGLTALQKQELKGAATAAMPAVKLDKAAAEAERKARMSAFKKKAASQGS